MMRATYSPEDNKLRLYPSTRLDSETYARVKSAGFKWAPRQELFVAPAWSPAREDLLLELCGEIGDEDTSLVDRAEMKAERFEEYSDKRADESDRARAAVSAIADNIPLGQPILVGHHSERRARKDAERIENGMRKAIKLWETSKYWQMRAAGAIAHAKYKERPDVRARRIKGIEADKRKQERARDEAEHLVRFWNGELFARNPTTGERKKIEITEENRSFLYDILGKMPSSGVQFRGIDNENWYSAWHCLAPDGERYNNCPIKTVEEIKISALRVQASVIERCKRWIAHYDNRLMYERAMLSESGGTEAVKKGPEKGGACKCWASHRGAWSYIKKVNKVSVTVEDNWGNGGKNFTRTIPFDKLTAIMSKAEVDAEKAAGHITDTTDGTGFFLDESTKAEHITTEPAKQELEKEQKMQAMKDALRAGVQVVSAPQLFPTPPEVAKKMVEYADIETGQRILEPSAGTGNLVTAIEATDTRTEIVAVELNIGLAQILGNGNGSKWGIAEIVQGDFLEQNGNLGKFDRVVMNPPFENGADIKHIRHALTFLKPGGKLVALCANGPRQREAFMNEAEHWEDLPAGSFREQGTNVNVALMVLTA